jgi:uncharacterized membrane protein YkvA (DUF1232 family)
MLDRVKELSRTLKAEIGVYRQVMRDPRTPWAAKVLIGLAVGYALSPIDLIPDFIPVVGHVDDLIIVPALIAIGLRLVPREVVADCRRTTGSARVGSSARNESTRRISPS